MGDETFEAAYQDRRSIRPMGARNDHPRHGEVEVRDRLVLDEFDELLLRHRGGISKALDRSGAQDVMNIKAVGSCHVGERHGLSQSEQGRQVRLQSKRAGPGNEKHQEQVMLTEREKRRVPLSVLEKAKVPWFDTREDQKTQTQDGACCCVWRDKEGVPKAREWLHVDR